MNITASVLATFGTLVMVSAHAAPADSTTALSGVPMNVAKLLNNRPAEPAASTVVPLSGVPMREATVRLGQDRSPPIAPSLAPALSGVPLWKAKRP